MEQLAVSKYLLQKGEKILSENSPVSSGLAISLFQDAVESIIWTIAKEVEAEVKGNVSFEQFWNIIPQAKKNTQHIELPLSAKMHELNKARVNFKHYGILPAQTEATKFSGYAAEFAQEAVLNFFRLNFENLSLVDILNEEDIRNHLKEAQSFLKEDDLSQCIISCAKAEYLSLRKFREIFPPVDYKLSHAGDFFGGNQEHSINSLFNYLGEYLEALRSSCIVNFLGMDLVEYARFRSLAPYIVMTANGKLHCNMKYREKYTPADANFCIEYATRTAISVQQVGM